MKMAGPILWNDEKTGEVVVAETEFTFGGAILIGIRFIRELRRYRLDEEVAA